MAGRRSKKRKNVAPMILTVALVLVLVALAVVAAFFFATWLQRTETGASLLPGGGNTSTTPSENVQYRPGQILPTWTGTEQVTMLVLGIDQRSQEEGPWRTDTMMVLTLDPVTKNAGVMSIPRDLWVPIPGYQEGRINTAHFLGDLYNLPGGGPGLAVDTVEYNLGVPISHYARVNFQGFIEVVDLIGGIDVYVEETINDPTYPGPNYDYDPFYIEAGWHHLNGETALKYARTRHGSSDFDRARRQQQVVLAVLDQVTNLKLLPSLAGKAPEIYETLQTHIQTDLAQDQIMALAALAVQVEKEQIRFGVIDQKSTQNYITPDGAQVLIPLREEMRKIRDYIFWADEPTPDVSNNVSQALVQSQPTVTPETATVAVLNGTGQAGLAGTTGDYLIGQGLNVTLVQNADRNDYSETLIILNRDKPQTASRLTGLLQVPESAIVRGTGADAGYDIVVILGADYLEP